MTAQLLADRPTTTTMTMRMTRHDEDGSKMFQITHLRPVNLGRVVDVVPSDGQPAVESADKDDSQ